MLSIGAFTLFCHDVHGFTEVFLSFFVTFVIVSCSRVCLLVVSRTIGAKMITEVRGADLGVFRIN